MADSSGSRSADLVILGAGSGGYACALRAAELDRTPRDDTGTGDDPLAEVVPSGHGLDADAGDYLQD